MTERKGRYFLVSCQRAREGYAETVYVCNYTSGESVALYLSFMESTRRQSNPLVGSREEAHLFTLAEAEAVRDALIWPMAASESLSSPTVVDIRREPAGFQRGAVAFYISDYKPNPTRRLTACFSFNVFGPPKLRTSAEGIESARYLEGYLALSWDDKRIPKTGEIRPASPSLWVYLRGLYCLDMRGEFHLRLTPCGPRRSEAELGFFLATLRELIGEDRNFATYIEHREMNVILDHQRRADALAAVCDDEIPVLLPVLGAWRRTNLSDYEHTTDTSPRRTYMLWRSQAMTGPAAGMVMARVRVGDVTQPSREIGESDSLTGAWALCCQHEARVTADALPPLERWEDIHTADNNGATTERRFTVVDGPVTRTYRIRHDLAIEGYEVALSSNYDDTWSVMGRRDTLHTAWAAACDVEAMLDDLPFNVAFGRPNLTLL